MTEHSPQEFATALGAKLATRSRHVCAFIGAGAAKACGLPDVRGLEAKVQTTLTGANLDAFKRLLAGRNIEQVLSRLRRIASLVTGAETVDGLTATQAAAVDKAVCQAIVSALDIGAANLDPMSHLAAWAARADYRAPVEIFTVNYDLLLETALEEHGVPYFDGFVGNLQARFRADLVEAPLGDPGGYVASRFVRLWKLHGSVNWVRSSHDQILRIGRPAADLPAAIYPSDAKYEESRRVPFLVLQDRLRRALHQPETIVLVSGFSFADDHLNEMLFDAAIRRERSEFVVFSYDDISEDLAKRAKRTPNMQVVGRKEAILGGARGVWREPVGDIPDLWESKTLALPDFSHLASYLARCSGQDGEAYGGA
ncbi:MAG: SIR2 family protein [Candidatus Eisenbacteria bacterium]